MSLTTGDTVFLSISLTSFVAMFSALGYGLYLAHTEMEKMLEHLKNCPVIINSTWYLKLGMWGRMVMLGFIAGIFMFPKVNISSGNVSLEDVSNFPSSIRIKLVVFFWISLVAVLVMMLLILAAYMGLFCLLDNGVACKAW